jgi:mono/diheme cytochrome c family protein
MAFLAKRWAMPLLFVVVVVCGPQAVFAADGEPEAAAAPLDFTRDVQPILARRCYHCHGPNDAESGLRLHDRTAATAELESGTRAIVPGNVEESELIARVSTKDEWTRMPPEGDPLKAEEIATLRAWIAQDAPYAKHWAFEPVKQPPLPEVKRVEWPIHEVDRFILARLESKGIAPNPPADKRTLVRRVYLDVTGLPPTPEQVAEFLADESTDAYERLVDRLLASPHYGERLGRLWLDVVRYAETNSYERDNPKPNAWKYRDYVIRAFNNDKSYDEFIREQLAGDELPEVTEESMTATGFFRLGVWDDEPADREQAKYDGFDDIIRTTSEGFLGLTVGCARCHDHKIDPIAQADYYKMLSFFHDITPHDNNDRHACNSQADFSSPEWLAHFQELDQREKSLTEQMTVIEQRGIEKMPGPDQRATEGRERNRVLREKLESHLSAEDWQAYGELKRQLEAVRRERAEMPPRNLVLSVGNAFRDPPKTHIHFRGNPHAPQEEVQPGFPGFLDAEAPAITPIRDRSGRRTALANWIASPDNRMTARVMVNRLWQHVMGRGIVRSSNNFGGLGIPPTHPELLDWLAVRFVEGDWQVKPIVRLILTSQTYRMSSAAREDALARDPANDLFWRMDLRRLDAEEIRDALLATTGELNLELFGPSVYPKISAEVLQGQSQPGKGWPTSKPEVAARRTIYVHVKRSLIHPLLAAFDYPDPDNPCEARFKTTQPAQALAMLNSEFVNEQAGSLAERIEREAGNDVRAQIERAIWLTLARGPQDGEIDHAIELIDLLKTEHDIEPKQALRYWCLVLLNRNEFLYRD